nr:MAG TPA: hypothetical protein [Caudoviricetes sp.]
MQTSNVCYAYLRNLLIFGKMNFPKYVYLKNEYW